MNGYHILVFISENCQAASSLPLYPYPDAGPPFSDWLLLMLKNSEPTMLINFNQEPVGLILVIMMRLLRYDAVVLKRLFFIPSVTSGHIALGIRLLTSFSVIWMK